MAEIKEAIAKVEESSRSEEKSSMGDKYETGKAMSHQEIFMLSTQLDNLHKEYQKLFRLQKQARHTMIQSGSLVRTESHLCFIGAAIGTLLIEGEKINFISEQAPLSKLLMGKQEGQEFLLNQKQIKVLEIY